MTPSAFLTQLAVTFDEGPIPPEDRRELAQKCRDYATIAAYAENPVHGSYFATIKRKRDKIAIAATT